MHDDRLRELKRMSILVVDDLRDIRAMVSTLLECEGYDNVLQADSGGSALALLEGGTPVDLVLLDICMPDTSGYEVLERLRRSESLRSIPVIMITGVDELDSVIRCVENGAEGYLTKPIEETLLRACVQANLERRHLREKERELLREVEAQKERSEDLLYEVIPEAVARRLTEGEQTIADWVDDVTVLFADLVGFTELCSAIGAAEVVSILNEMFGALDQLAAAHRIDKVKTIGDGFMVVGGIGTDSEGHATRCMDFAMAALEWVESFNERRGTRFRMRIGMHTGPVVAGVIGLTRFTYDLWGETVNLASRMESLGVPGWIQVSAATYERVRSTYRFEPRGRIAVKGKGAMEAYLACLDTRRAGDLVALTARVRP